MPLSAPPTFDELAETASELRDCVARARDEHFKLVWLVGGSSARRTRVMDALVKSEAGAYLDLGKKLSGALLDVPVHLRAASVHECFAAFLGAESGTLTCLDHLDILFESSLKTNAVELVKNASRHALLVASWPGIFEQGNLVFGPSDHPSHKEIPERELESAVHII
jgi:hypothetical protein